MAHDRMTVRPIPQRHWRSYGDDKLPTGTEAMSEPFATLPSWFMRIECDRCGKVRMVSETHTPQRAMMIRDIIARMRHDDCGGRGRTVQHALLSCARRSARDFTGWWVFRSQVGCLSLPQMRSSWLRSCS
jgi:hypothetical protein